MLKFLESEILELAELEMLKLQVEIMNLVDFEILHDLHPLQAHLIAFAGASPVLQRQPRHSVVVFSLWRHRETVTSLASGNRNIYLPSKQKTERSLMICVM